MSADRHAAQIVARLVVGLPVGPPILATLPEPWLGLAHVVLSADDTTRTAALKTALAGRPERDAILDAIRTAVVAMQRSNATVTDVDAPVLLADVASAPVRWIWPGRLPIGKLTVLDGDPNLGKSALTLDLAARVSADRPMPDGAPADLTGPRGVVLLSAEDGLADTIRPRLLAAGADLTRIAALTCVLDRVRARPDPDDVADGQTLRLPTLADLAAIRRAITAVDATLVVVDPIMAYLPRGTDSRLDSDVRALLARLAGLAATADVAILVVRHLTKARGGSSLYRGGGSIGIIGAARSGLLVGKDPTDPAGARRVLATTKANLALSSTSLAYHLETAACSDGTESLRVVWDGPSDHTADELLGRAGPHSHDHPSALAEARDVLASILADGPKPATDVLAEARAAGVGERLVRRARESLGIRPRKDGFRGCWVWELPVRS